MWPFKSKKKASYTAAPIVIAEMPAEEAIEALTADDAVPPEMTPQQLEPTKALFLALQKNDLAGVKKALAEGAYVHTSEHVLEPPRDPNHSMDDTLGTDSGPCGALEIAIDNHNPEMARILLKAGANPNWSSGRNGSMGPWPLLLDHAIQQLDPRFGAPPEEREAAIAVVAAMLEHGAKLVKRDRYGDHFSALHEAAEIGSGDIIKLLLTTPGANVNQRDFMGHTPLHIASMHGHVNAVHALLDHPDIKVNACADHDFGNDKKTALDKAENRGKYMINAGSPENYDAIIAALKAKGGKRFNEMSTTEIAANQSSSKQQVGR